MIDLLKLKKLKSQRLTTLLGLSLDGSRLDGVVLRRTNGSVQLRQSFSATLSLDPLTAAPELVAREIRNQLDAAGVRERDCVVCLPLKWALTAHIEMPAMPEADVPGFLQIEAERSFHSDVETLHYAVSRYSAAGKQYVTLVGVPRANVALLEKVLRAAKLKPRSFSIGITALQRPANEASNGVLALAIGETNVGLQITSDGGIAALRALEGALEMEGVRRVLHADIIAREARITLGQLSVGLRESVKRIRIFGPRDLAQELADEMELRFEAMGLKIEIVEKYSENEFGVHLPEQAPVSPAFGFATEILARRATPLEFLPPKIPAWQQFATRYGSGKLRMAGAAAAAALVMGVGLFAYQQWQIQSLQSQWDQMSLRVGDLQSLQNKIQQYRPWYDDSLGGLAILKQLTLAFPEDGSVSAKALEIRDLSTVTCTGTARDYQALLRMQEHLRGMAGVADVKVTQMRGRSPILFTFDFRWNEGGRSAN
jgi:Tfp pilus assembly PilM family ATPase